MTETQKQIKLEIVNNACRWANNILSEVLANHGPALNDQDRERLRSVTTNLQEIDFSIAWGKQINQTHRQR
jgi:hypothetical protein